MFSENVIMIVHLIVGLIKKISLHEMIFFPEPYTHSKNIIKFELDLSNYATKSDLKEGAGVDISTFAKKGDLVHLKSDVDDLGFGKLKTVPVDLSKISNVVKVNVVEKTLQDDVATKVNVVRTIDTSDLVKKADCNTKNWGYCKENS